MKPSKKIFNNSLVILAIFILLSSCNMRRSAMGVQDRLFVFADSALWQQIKGDVTDTFEDIIHTPRAERSFYVHWSRLKELQGLKGRMNIVFAGTTQPGSAVNDYLLKSLPESFIDDVKAGKKFYFYKDGLFARDQFSLFMIAPDARTFNFNFDQLKKQIYEQFLKKYYARLEESMFDKGEQKEQEAYLKKYFGYTVRVQHDYFVADQDLPPKYVWLRRMKPDRSLSIWRLPVGQEIRGLKDFISVRNKTIGPHYSGDRVVTDETRLDTVLFRGKQTPRMIGVWQNDSLMVGGPFRTFIVNKPDSNETYLIDISVTAPSKRKKPFLDQLRVIAGTFEFAGKPNKKSE